MSSRRWEQGNNTREVGWLTSGYWLVNISKVKAGGLPYSTVRGRLESPVFRKSWSALGSLCFRKVLV